METEVQRLRRYISPLEDKEFTEKLKARMKEVDFVSKYHIRNGKLHHKVLLKELWEKLFPNESYTTKHLAIMGRSLQALLWTRSVENGSQIYIKSKEDIDADGF